MTKQAVLKQKLRLKLVDMEESKAKQRLRKEKKQVEKEARWAKDKGHIHQSPES